MQKIRTTLLIIALITMTGCQQTKKEHAKHVKAWKLDKQNSTISLISTKNNKISEVFAFTQFEGTINADGYLEISIELASLESSIPLRNQRLQKHLFATENFPLAEIHTQLKAEDLNTGIHSISFDVDMHGVSSILQAEFMVFDQRGTKTITLHKPLIINAKDFGLENGITTLKKLAKLQSIAFTVPLNIILTFEAAH